MDARAVLNCRMSHRVEEIEDMNLLWLTTILTAVLLLPAARLRGEPDRSRTFSSASASKSASEQDEHAVEGRHEIVDQLETDNGALLEELGAAAERVVLSLSECLQDENSDVRRSAAEALVKMGPEASSAAPLLIDALQDENSQVRKSAAEALGRMAPRARYAVPAIIEALKDESGAVRRAAADALDNFGVEASSTLEYVTTLLQSMESSNCLRNEIDEEARRQEASQRVLAEETQQLIGADEKGVGPMAAATWLAHLRSHRTAESVTVQDVFNGLQISPNECDETAFAKLKRAILVCTRNHPERHTLDESQKLHESLQQQVDRLYPICTDCSKDSSISRLKGIAYMCLLKTFDNQIRPKIALLFEVTRHEAVVLAAALQGGIDAVSAKKDDHFIGYFVLKLKRADQFGKEEREAISDAGQRSLESYCKLAIAFPDPAYFDVTRKVASVIEFNKPGRTAAALHDALAAARASLVAACGNRSGKDAANAVNQKARELGRIVREWSEPAHTEHLHLYQ